MVSNYLKHLHIQELKWLCIHKSKCYLETEDIVIGYKKLPTTRMTALWHRSTINLRGHMMYL